MATWLIWTSLMCLHKILDLAIKAWLQSSHAASAPTTSGANAPHNQVDGLWCSGSGSRCWTFCCYYSIEYASNIGNTNQTYLMCTRSNAYEPGLSVTIQPCGYITSSTLTLRHEENDRYQAFRSWVDFIALYHLISWMSASIAEHQATIPASTGTNTKRQVFLLVMLVFDKGHSIPQGCVDSTTSSAAFQIRSNSVLMVGSDGGWPFLLLVSHTYNSLFQGRNAIASNQLSLPRWNLHP